MPLHETSPGSPAGTRIDFVEITSAVTVSATTSATANTVITGNSVVYDGSTRVKIEFTAPRLITGATNSSTVQVTLWDGATEAGILCVAAAGSGNGVQAPGYGCVYLTPSAGSHQYIVKAYRTASNGVVQCGNGAAATDYPTTLSITKA